MYADQTVKVTVGFDGDKISAGDTIDVVIKKDGSDVARKSLTLSDKQAEAVVDFAIPASQAIVPGEYTVNLSNAAGFVGEISVADNTAADRNWSGHEAVMNAEADADDEYYFSADGDPVDFAVEDVLDASGASIGAASYVFAYNADDGSDGEYVAGTDAFLEEAPSAEGHYLVTVWPTAEYADGAYLGVTEPIVVPFEIGPAAQGQGYSLYQYDADYPANTSDTTFVYTGKQLLGSGGTSSLIGLAVDGTAVPFASILNDKSFEAINGSSAEGSYYNLESDANVQDAGDYAVKVNKKTVAGGELVEDGTVAYLTLTVEPFDLSGATVTADDKAAADGAKSPVLNVTNGTDTLTAKAAEALVVANTSFTAAKGVTQPAGVPSDWSLKGEYGLSVSPKVTDGTADKNFAGSATATVKVFDSVDSNFQYEGQAFDYYVGEDALVFDRSEGEAFDANQVTSDGKGVDTTSAKYYDIVFRDAAGDVVASPDAAGAYTAEVSVKSDLSYTKGGSDTLSFRVVESADVNVYFTVDGKPMAGTSGNTVTFTGQAIPYSVAVKAAGETVPASDYAVKVTVKSTGEEVSEVVDPGTYVISVESDKYAVSETCEFSVTEAVYAGFEVVQQSFGWDPEAYSEGFDKYAEGIPYTGSAVEVAVRAYNVVNGERAYTDLAPELYTLTFADKDGKKVAAEDLSKADAYTATIKLTQAAEDANIKEIKDKKAAFSIVDEIAGYKDVHAADWFADVVAKATGLGYVKGVGGTDALFVPNVSISRADAAIIIFRMAGGKEDQNTDVTYPTQFTDVPGDSYFAQAVEWASKAGVVNGTSETTFDPYANVTRQELATMLYRAFGGGASADASALDAFVDADQVADWAETAMAWAVEEGYMNGKGADDLQPQGQATRAEVAALSVRVAPAEEIEE